MRLQQQLERQASKGENISVAVLLSDDDDDQSARTGEKEKRRPTTLAATLRQVDE